MSSERQTVSPQRKKARKRISLVAVVALLATACTHETFFHSYRHIAPNGWRYTDTLEFLLPPAPQTEVYSLSVGLRIDACFPYQSLTLVVETKADSLSLLRKDTLFWPLTQDDGTLGGSGVNLLQFETPAGHLQLREGQQARVRIYHIMSRETMPHIHDVGLRCSRSDEGA